MIIVSIIPCLILSSLTLITLIAFITIKRQVKSKNKDLNLPPGTHGWPLLGETMEFIRARNNGCLEKFVRDRMERYDSRVFRTSLFGESMAVLCGPSGNKFLFSNEDKLVAFWWPASVKKLIGQSLITAAGADALHMKKMMSYFFSPDAFTKLYIKTIDTMSQQHLNAQWRGKKELVVYRAIKLYTFELACRLFMSIEESEQIEKLAALFNIFVGGVISIPLSLPGTRFYSAMKATVAIKKEIREIVRQRKMALEGKARMASQDLLSHLLLSPDENGKFMSESVITNNILMLLFAGHDTSSSTITMVMKILAEHPHVYEKVLAEQNEIASCKESGECLNWEDIKKMKYSWNAVSETMRLWPPVAGTFREAIRNISYAGYDIPKGWKFYLDVQLTHKDSSFFHDHAKFDPSRFEKDNAPVPYAFVPFGGGPRMCLGKEFARLEILVFLHNVVRRFRWNLAIPGEKIICDPFAIPENGLPIRLHTQHA